MAKLKRLKVEKGRAQMSTIKKTITTTTIKSLSIKLRGDGEIEKTENPPIIVEGKLDKTTAEFLVKNGLKVETVIITALEEDTAKYAMSGEMFAKYGTRIETVCNE